MLKNLFEKIANIRISLLRSHLNWIAMGMVLIISISSVIHTNRLVNQVKERENRQMKLYASSLKFLSDKKEANYMFILDNIVSANHTIPVILTDQSGHPIDYKNISRADKIKNKEKRTAFLLSEIEEMKSEHKPISIVVKDDQNTIHGQQYIYYKNSVLLNEIKYYPHIRLFAIIIFGIAIFIVVNYFKRAEQNHVWVGLAKETAHQLGTPLSSLMAWSEYFKEWYPDQKETIMDFDKDVNRLKIITDRFSNIGSEPQLEKQNITDIVKNIVDYLQKRLPSKISISISSFPHENMKTKVNVSLFAWVIENLCKNAVDAMYGNGKIYIQILRTNGNQIAIDVKDSGKGIARSKINDVFRPGFTTKKSGWGLGLALTRRIIEQYHKGKIFIKESEVNKGTTFRIYLKA